MLNIFLDKRNQVNLTKKKEIIGSTHLMGWIHWQVVSNKNR